MTSIGGALARGLIAGAVGTAAMTLSSTLEMQLRRRPPSMTPAEALESALDLDPPDDPLDQERLSNAVHWAYGTAWGIPRSVIQLLGVRGRNADLLHFAAMWGSSLALLPTLRVTPPPDEWGTTEIGIDAFHHLVYAITAGAAYEALSVV